MLSSPTGHNAFTIIFKPTLIAYGQSQADLAHK